MVHRARDAMLVPSDGGMQVGARDAAVALGGNDWFDRQARLWLDEERTAGRITEILRVSRCAMALATKPSRSPRP